MAYAPVIALLLVQLASQGPVLGFRPDLEELVNIDIHRAQEMCAEVCEQLEDKCTVAAFTCGECPECKQTPGFGPIEEEESDEEEEEKGYASGPALSSDSQASRDTSFREPEKQCDNPSNRWYLKGAMLKGSPAYIAEGNHGAIFKVSTANKGAGYSAWKEAKTKGGRAEIQYEVEVMKRGQTCSNLMTIQEGGSTPCIVFDDGKTLESSGFVSELMHGSLYDWVRKFKPKMAKSVFLQCAKEVSAQLKDALVCLHNSAKYIHSDLKSDNVYFKGLTRDNCPKLVKLADFGLAEEIGYMAHKFDGEWYDRSVHLPSVVFKGNTETPSDAKSTRGEYKVGAVIDWCSFVYMMRSEFLLDTRKSVLGKEGVLGSALGKSVDCGLMGAGRKTKIAGPK